MHATRTILVLTAICVAFFVSGSSVNGGQASDPNAIKPTTATMELTRLDVNDLTLRLTYKVRNDTDHDVWVCSDAGARPVEIYLTQDKQTLLIRKRLDVPCNIAWYRPPLAGTYVRLRHGDNRVESLVADLPVIPQFGYASQCREEVAQTVRQLAIEIGYYDQDLPTLVRGIRDMADQFLAGGGVHLDWSIAYTYFPGLRVQPLLGTNKDPYSQGYVYIPYSGQGLIGEKALRIDVNGVSIPYKGAIEAK